MNDKIVSSYDVAFNDGWNSAMTAVAAWANRERIRNGTPTVVRQRDPFRGKRRAMVLDIVKLHPGKTVAEIREIMEAQGVPISTSVVATYLRYWQVWGRAAPGPNGTWSYKPEQSTEQEQTS